MNQQNDLIKMFRQLYQEPSYSRMAKMLGIQKTRAFRICNGHEMKLSEYLTMQNLVDERTGKSEIESIIKDCLSKLSKKRIAEISALCKRHLRNYELLHDTTDIGVTASFAS